MIKPFLKRNIVLQASIYSCLLVAMIFLLYLFNYCYKICLVAIDNTFAVEYAHSGDIKEKLKELDLNSYDVVNISLSTNCEVLYKNDTVEVLGGRLPEHCDEVLTGSAEVEVGSTVSYGGKIFKVVGYALTTAELVFSSEYDFSEGEVIGVVFMSKPFKSHSKIEKELLEIFDNDKVYVPENPSLWDLITDIPLIGGMIVYVLLSLIPIPIAVVFLLRKYDKVISVCRFLGFTPKNIVKKLALMYAVVISSVLLLSNLTYLLLERVWLNSVVSMFGTYTLKFSDYLLVDFAFLVITIFFSLPVIRQIKTIKVEL